MIFKNLINQQQKKGVRDEDEKILRLFGAIYGADSVHVRILVYRM